MLIVNEIRLDTCKCIVEFEHDWDEANPVDNPELRLHRVIRKCDEHSNVKDSDLLDTIMAENRSKNGVLAKAKEVLDIPIEELKERSSFSFDRERKLSVDIKDITNEQKQAIDQRVAADLPEKERAVLKEVRKK